MDTTMGLTPLDGLIMGTRCGSIDPATVCYLVREGGYTIDEVDTMMNKQSGLLALSGISSDSRDIEAGAERGDANCKMAFDMFYYRTSQLIMEMAQAMHGFDTMAFSAGIGENSDVMRAGVAKELEWMGVKIDPEKAWRYALPRDVVDKLHIRKYGAHGTSHRYIWPESRVAPRQPREDAALVEGALVGPCVVVADAGRPVGQVDGTAALELAALEQRLHAGVVLVRVGAHVVGGLADPVHHGAADARARLARREAVHHEVGDVVEPGLALDLEVALLGPCLQAEGANDGALVVLADELHAAQHVLGDHEARRVAVRPLVGVPRLAHVRADPVVDLHDGVEVGLLGDPYLHAAPIRCGWRRAASS